MKYNTINTSSLASEGRKSTLTIYTDPDFVKEKVTEAEIASVRGELEIVQRALKLQTRRCRQLVAEYTRRLQQKEQQYQSERMLRDDQLAKVLRALLIFEARLRQEQKFISHQLTEKDYIIKKQHSQISKLMSNQYCKHCNQYYSPVLTSRLESLDSSSEYVATDYHDYQSSNFESLDSSSETYATISEKEYTVKGTTISEQSFSGEENVCTETNIGKKVFQKNKFNKDSVGRRGRKFGHRKSVGTYFEVLKLRNDSPMSTDGNTSNDYENLDSLPQESLTDKISMVSNRIEGIFANSACKEKIDNSTISISSTDSDCNDTVIQNCTMKTVSISEGDEDENSYQNTTVSNVNLQNGNCELENEKPDPLSKINESITVFDGDVETNDKWYASGSEQEDEEQRDIYRNNPVLECMNQILLHNINDTISSPPKTPNVERKFGKNNKRVKFSDEEELSNQKEDEENLEDKTLLQGNYYETPIQKVPNFYETPQSIYSNDYEQILSKCNESFSTTCSPTKIDNLQEKEVNKLANKKLSVIKSIDFESRNTNYYDMDAQCENENNIVKKNKILRTPPALPPKPTNLVSKYKLQNLQHKLNLPPEPGIESEPDYCSISELNLPTKPQLVQKIQVIAEINTPNVNESIKEIKPKPTQVDSLYDPVAANTDLTNLVSKNIETFSIQLAKQTPIKTENINISPNKFKSKQEPEIPKLPQVSEIIIPDETETKQDEERITQDNYVKNNSQILKLKTNRTDTLRRPIIIGSSVSSLITGFNNQQLLSEIQQKPSNQKINKLVFSSFGAAQNSEKQPNQKKTDSLPKTLNFEKFDLSQNFEEFKLEDCEIGEEYNIDNTNDASVDTVNGQIEEHEMPHVLKSPTTLKSNLTRVEMVRATNNMTIPQLNLNSIQQFRKKLEHQKSKESTDSEHNSNAQMKNQNQPTYEHFLECTGLSSKSILTPSRLLSNHKSMLKPKDVKLRSKVKSNSVFERQGNTIKYWSEPYI